MTDNVQIALIAGLTTACPLMLMHWLNYRALKLKVLEVKADVKTIEIATNSMKDALIQAARVEGHAAGMKEEQQNPSK